MGATEGTRKVLQDFVTPELRSIAVRIEALEKRMDGSERRACGRFMELGKKLDELIADSRARSEAGDQRLFDSERRTEQRFDAVQSSIERSFDENERRAERRHEDSAAILRNVLGFAALNQRIARPEAEREASHQ